MTRSQEHAALVPKKLHLVYTTQNLAYSSHGAVVIRRARVCGLILFCVAAALALTGYFDPLRGGSERVVRPAISPPRSASAVEGFYGSGLGADGLYNIPLGGADMYTAPYKVEVSWRFRAGHTGALRAVHPYLMFGSEGYSGGDGGTVRLQVQTDEGPNHYPSGITLAWFLYTKPLEREDILPVFPLSPAPTLTAGSLYHLVFSNTSAGPSKNFVSLNHLWLDALRPVIPRQPTVSDTDLHTIHRENGGAWTDTRYINTTPVFELDYADGFVEGRGYIEVWVNGSPLISGASRTRETFTVSGPTRKVSRVSLRATRVRGSDPLTIRLETGAGTLVEQGTIRADAFPLSNPPAYVWVTYSFSSPRILTSGQSYNLVQIAPPTSAYQTFPMRKGAENGLSPATYFADGRAQQNTGSGWVDWFPATWGANRPDGDLQFYFTVSP